MHDQDIQALMQLHEAGERSWKLLALLDAAAFEAFHDPGETPKPARRFLSMEPPTPEDYACLERHRHLWTHRRPTE